LIYCTVLHCGWQARRGNILAPGDAADGPGTAAAIDPWKLCSQFVQVLETIHNFCLHKDQGRAGCYYGDTTYDSLSAVYGYNQALSHIGEFLEPVLPFLFTEPPNQKNVTHA